VTEENLEKALTHYKEALDMMKYLRNGKQQRKYPYTKKLWRLFHEEGKLPGSNGISRKGKHCR